MAKFQIKIDTIFDGFTPSDLFGSAGQYETAIGIDPDMPISESGKKAAGIIRPVNYESFSQDKVNSYPIAFITTPKNSNIYVVLANGRLLSYDSSFENETLLGTTSEAVAQGAFYHNNYICIMTNTDVSRYGPLSGTPALVNNVWTAATLGSQTQLANTTYPVSLLSVPYLNHHGVTHSDGAAYFLDMLNGIGRVHKIQTTMGSFEGDTNSGSAYEVLDLPANYMPITICSVGNDLVVAASFTQNSIIHQGKAALFFFSPVDVTPSYYKSINIPYSICSVLTYNNGELLGFAGDIRGGYSLFRYAGGDTVEPLKIIESGSPPLQNAHAAVGQKIVWAADNESPMVSSGLYGYSSKSGLFSRGLHHIALSGFNS